MPITVLKNNVPWGPFTRAQVKDGLSRGDFTLQYLAHAPGLKEWLPLGEVLDHFDRASSLPPVPGTRDLPPVPREGAGPAVPPVPMPAIPPVPMPPPPVMARPPALPVRERAEVPPAPAAIPAAVRPPEPVVELVAAPFIPRFFAFGIDCAVLFLPIFFLYGLGALTIQIQAWVQHTDAETMRQEWALLHRNFKDLLLLVALGGGWLYAALLECSHWQATVGKQWAGMKVTDARGAPVSFFRATGRHAAKFLSAVPCFLGFTMALFSPRRLALHDRLAGTRVLRK